MGDETYRSEFRVILMEKTIAGLHHVTVDLE